MSTRTDSSCALEPRTSSPREEAERASRDLPHCGMGHEGCTRTEATIYSREIGEGRTRTLPYNLYKKTALTGCRQTPIGRFLRSHKLFRTWAETTPRHPCVLHAWNQDEKVYCFVLYIEHPLEGERRCETLWMCLIDSCCSVPASCSSAVQGHRDHIQLETCPCPALSPSRKPPLWARPGKESSGLSKGSTRVDSCFPQVK